MQVYWLGRAAYAATWDLQEQLRQRVLGGGPEALLLCEHEPVLTLGRYASDSEILADAATLRAHGVAAARSSRGGKVTYHGPGQLVVYPVVRLRAGVLAHVQWLAEAVVEVARGFGVAAAFQREQVGVWAGARKLAAIGVNVQRRVAIHGLALNVTAAATAPFRSGWFVPCGLAQSQTTSLAEEMADAAATSPAPDVAAVVEPLAAALCRRAGWPAAPVLPSTVSLLSQT